MSIFVQTAHAADAATQPSVFAQLILPVAFFLIFYFVLIRPQSKRNKQHRAMIEALAVGNEVVFAGGLMGVIKKLDDNYAVVSLNNSAEIKIQRASVISVLPAGTLANI